MVLAFNRSSTLTYLAEIFDIGKMTSAVLIEGIFECRKSVPG